METIGSTITVISDPAEEVFISNSDENSKLPEATSSDKAKDNIMSESAACARPFTAAPLSVHPFKTRDEFLCAMMEDVTEWLNSLFGLSIKSSELMFHLETGVLLCRLANILDRLMVGDEKHDSESTNKQATKTKDQQELTSAIRCSTETRPLAALGGSGAVVFRENAPRGSFQSRDNISNFLNWCRNRLKLADTVLFETEDLVAGKNERNVILCLLEVARRGSKHGMPVPELIELESEIDAELGQESMAEDGDEAERLKQEEEEEEQKEGKRRSGSETEQAATASDFDRICDVERLVEEDTEAMMTVSVGGRKELQMRSCDAASSSAGARLCLRIRDILRMPDRRPEVHRLREAIQMDMVTLDELVRRFLGNCRCPHQYPMIKVSEGKYRIGESLMLIFVRLLRSHVMLRIGGGWETLADYLTRHDPCRAAGQHWKKVKLTHANEETRPSKDVITPDKDKDIAETEQETPAEDKTAPERDQNALEKDENTPAENKNEPPQDQNVPEKIGNSSTENNTAPGSDETSQENEETHENLEDAKQ